MEVDVQVVLVTASSVHLHLSKEAMEQPVVVVVEHQISGWPITGAPVEPVHPRRWAVQRSRRKMVFAVDISMTEVVALQELPVLVVDRGALQIGTQSVLA